MKQKNMSKKSFYTLIAVITFAVIFWITWTLAMPGAQVSSTDHVNPQNEPALMRPYSPVLGRSDAPVTIVEFFDPACEACRAFYPLTKKILNDYPETVRLTLRYTTFHGEVSETAVRVLETARGQGVFAPVLESLLRDQAQWAAHGNFNANAILDIAELAGLNRKVAQGELNSPAVQAVLDQDAEDVASFGVRRTPTFYINGKLLEPFGAEELVNAVQSAVVESTGTVGDQPG